MVLITVDYQQVPVPLLLMYSLKEIFHFITQVCVVFAFTCIAGAVGIEILQKEVICLGFILVFVLKRL